MEDITGETSSSGEIVLDESSKQNAESSAGHSLLETETCPDVSAGWPVKGIIGAKEEAKIHKMHQSLVLW